MHSREFFYQTTLDIWFVSDFTGEYLRIYLLGATAMATATLPRMTGLNSGPSAATKSRSLVAACLAHALHDGYTDGLYAFLPVWQAQFGLSYMALAVVRALYFGTMGGLQIPAVRTLRGLSPRAALILSTVVAAMAASVSELEQTWKIERSSNVSLWKCSGRNSRSAAGGR